MFWTHDPYFEANRKKNGSGERYLARLEKFMKDEKPYPELRHWLLWVTHNCIAHPILGVLPNRHTAALHEISSVWLNKARISAMHFGDKEVPDLLPNRLAWIFHNTVSHSLIGLFPSAPTFKLHAWSARLISAVLDGYVPENIPDLKAWLVHNCIAHPLIGLFPIEAAFQYHDKTAEAMGVKGWV